MFNLNKEEAQLYFGHLLSDEDIKQMQEVDSADVDVIITETKEEQ